MKESRGGDGAEGGAEGREPLPPPQRARGRQDDVDPGGVELDEGELGEEEAEGLEGLAQDSREDLGDEGAREDVDDVAKESAEGGAPAARGLEEGVGAAEAGGYGEFGLGLGAVVGGGRGFDVGVCAGGWVVEGERLVGGGSVLIFDAGEDGVDVAHGVTNLGEC